ncbi:hypothetical protein FSP39_019054 [Pinctada imbricata]|uniref:Neurogenic mastermind-like N-terminal domain-containing protein n=1 Tax=Pinctada imbricata TaxID=66713 RepID=A0AA88YEX3_PINIB|nr:hypothetical protein FSP39_019054 [Pinctada imbricata]
MGDFAPPKRKDVFDRLRRRLELYRRHRNCGSSRYDNAINTIYEQQQKDTIIQRQRWLDSKAKKASKQKPKDTTATNHGGVERNLVVTQKLKRKIDGVHSESGETPEDSEPSAAKSQVNNNTTGFNVSVHIEQQKNNTTNVNVNVRTTVETSAENSSNVEATTSVECKREPQEEHSDSESASAADILPAADLDAILASIQTDKDSPSDEQLLEELRRFEQIYQSKFSDDSNNSNDATMYSGMTSTSPGLQKPVPSGFEPSSPFDGSQNFPVRSPPVTDYRGTPSSIAETGPAAQTLKQMAAQHQNMHSNGFAPKGMDPYGNPPMRSNSYPGQNGFQNYDQNQYMGREQYSMPQHSQNVNNMHMPYPQNKADPALTYNGTKPLTHYQPHTAQPGQQPPPSSLQQLQNQVAHFTQNQQMEITQTQHVEVTDGAHRMQMSQTQMLQMRPPQQPISMSQQQQIFSMPGVGGMGPSPQPPPQYAANEHMDSQMMHDKMRRERQAQARSILEKHQLQQQYTNRPPPEYKMQHSAPEGYHASNMGPNPLQTMQNMVNSTNTMPPSQYGPIKSENSQMTMQNGMMQSQMMTMQRMNSTGGPTPEMCAGGQAYQAQTLQRQQSYPGAQLSAQQSKQARPPEPTYTSAIMRNQRPPNVNVGPDGLNISQPRNQHEWPRAMMPASARQPVPAGMTNMMQYHYGNQNGMMASTQMQGMQMRQRPNMQMSAMHSQAAMMQGNAQSQQMMMQQNMQMSQRTMGARPPAPSTGMVPASQMTGGASQPDDIMNLLDSAAQNSSPELIDSITVQSSDANNDAAWLDEILGGK